MVVGRIGRPQGIKGEVTVEVRTDDPEERFAVGSVLVTDPVERGPLTVVGVRQQGRYLVVHLAGPDGAPLPDRNAAERFRDTLLLVDVADLPPLADEDEYYDSQLLGLSAVLADETPLGSVADVLHLPHGDVLVIERPGGEDSPRTPELLVPFVKAIVPTVDVAGGRLVVEPPPGLLDLSEAPADDAEG
ncbi:MAG: ribosome maturation factor RimM [Mycobacteriales bacterium]